jgi:hypothetical protein
MQFDFDVKDGKQGVIFAFGFTMAVVVRPLHRYDVAEVESSVRCA